MELSFNSRFVTFVLVVRDSRKESDDDDPEFVSNDGGSFSLAESDEDAVENLEFGYTFAGAQ
jgi:hypothetical protein